MRRRLQIFVSSTKDDLLLERQAALEAILKAGDIPAGMELFTPGDQSQMEVIRQWIDDSDGYVLILGGRYGSIDSATGRSYVDLEYEYAGSKNIPRFAVVMSQDRIDAILAANPRDRKLEQANPDKYEAFRKGIVEYRVCEIFQDHKDVKNAVTHTLAKWKENKSFVGWVRAGERVTGDGAPPLKAEITTLRKELEKFTLVPKQARRLADQLLKVPILVPSHLFDNGKGWNTSLGRIFAAYAERYIDGVSHVQHEDFALNNFLYSNTCKRLALYGVLETTGSFTTTYKITKPLGEETLRILMQDE